MLLAAWLTTAKSAKPSLLKSPVATDWALLAVPKSRAPANIGMSQPAKARWPPRTKARNRTGRFIEVLSSRDAYLPAYCKQIENITPPEAVGYIIDGQIPTMEVGFVH